MTCTAIELIVCGHRYMFHYCQQVMVYIFFIIFFRNIRQKYSVEIFHKIIQYKYLLIYINVFFLSIYISLFFVMNKYILVEM